MCEHENGETKGIARQQSSSSADGYLPPLGGLYGRYPGSPERLVAPTINVLIPAFMLLATVMSVPAPVRVVSPERPLLLAFKVPGHKGY